MTGGRYFLIILDEHSRVTWTHLLHSKEQVKDILSALFAYVENHFKTSVKVVRSDNGTEILQAECSSIFAKKGIVHQRSVAGNPQQNGRVERKHRHLIETARAMRIHAGLPKKFWAECVLAATHIINMLPTAILKWKTPFERLMKRKPDYGHLRVIGCLCYASNSHRKGDKFT